MNDACLLHPCRTCHMDLSPSSLDLALAYPCRLTHHALCCFSRHGFEFMDVKAAALKDGIAWVLSSRMSGRRPSKAILHGCSGMSGYLVKIWRHMLARRSLPPVGLTLGISDGADEDWSEISTLR